MLRTVELHAPASCNPMTGVTACGLPRPDDFRQAHDQGARTIVNLCTDGETSFDEGALATSLDLKYEHIPIQGAADLTRENAIRLGKIIDLPVNQPVVVHCASGNRVGALLAMKAFCVDNADIETAIDIGRSAGLRAMEAATREALQRELMRDAGKSGNG